MRRFLLAAALLLPVAAHAQVSPSRWTQNYIPTLTDWKAALLFNGQSFSEAMNAFNGQLTDAVSALNTQINDAVGTLNTQIGTKITAQGGTGDSNTLTNASVSAQTLSSPAGTFNAPQSGSSLGVGSMTYLAPNQTIQGSATIVGNAPIIHLHSSLNPNNFDIWQDASGAGNLSVNDPILGRLNLYAHNVNIGGSSAGAVLDFYGGGGNTPLAMWQGSDGQGYIQSYGFNLNISSGTGWTYFNSTIQIGSGSLISDTTKCGSLSGAKGCLTFRDSTGTVSYAPYFQ